MIYIDPSVLPYLADAFTHYGELMGGIKGDLWNYLLDVKDRFREQKAILEKREEDAADQLKEAKERQKAASKTCKSASEDYENSTKQLETLTDIEEGILSEGESYEGELSDIKQQIQDQQETIEACELNLNSAIADLGNANVELQNAQSIYDDAKGRLDASSRIISDFYTLRRQYGAKLTTPQKDTSIDLDSKIYSFSVYQDYSIKTMLNHISKDYINKAVAALDDVQHKVDAILDIGRRYFGCDIAPARAVVHATGDTSGGSRRNIIATQASSGTFCPKCGQLKAICRCNEIVERSINGYINTKKEIEEQIQRAKALKEKIDHLRPLYNTVNSLHTEADQFSKEKESLKDEYNINDKNIDIIFEDRKRALLQAAWDREKDDEKVYRSPEMNALRDEAEGRHRENNLLKDKVFQLNDMIGEKQAEASAAQETLSLEERILGGALGSLEKEYKCAISKLEFLRKKRIKYRKRLRNYGVEIDKNGNINKVQSE